mmetsp:Transcript_11072/g.15359  ORF Transcript_11072/g.15359 Transcript_11072/m.15359 type:complete len:174 (-) Transcript_11072:357-878(-)
MPTTETGGCKDEKPSPPAKSEREAKEDVTKEVMDQFPSVGVEFIDKEHNDCWETIAKLQKSGSLSDLITVKDTLLDHFDHEEKLFKSTGFDDGGRFSKTTSHNKDHGNIISEIESEINRIKNMEQPSEQQIVTCEFALTLARRLKEHTDLYDMQYSSFMIDYFNQKQQKAQAA